MVTDNILKLVYAAQEQLGCVDAVNTYLNVSESSDEGLDIDKHSMISRVEGYRV